MYLGVHVYMYVYAYLSLYVVKLNNLCIYFFLSKYQKGRAAGSVGLKFEAYQRELLVYFVKLDLT